MPLSPLQFRKLFDNNGQLGSNNFGEQKDKFLPMFLHIPDSQTSITTFFNCGVLAQCEIETGLLSRAVLLNEL